MKKHSIFKEEMKNTMIIPTICMGALAVVLVYAGYRCGGNRHITGIKTAVNLTVTILPLLFFAFIVAGMVQALVPRESLAKWIGVESGMRGILLGTVAGAFAPGGPYVSLPIAAALLRSGAGAGTMVAFLTGWSLWAVSRLPMEVGILGWRFTFIRLMSTFFFPPVAGFIAQRLYNFFS